MSNELSRRGILGTLGAAALAGIALPFKPKPQDIVIATELPADESPGIDNDRRANVGYYLYDRRGRPVAVVTDLKLTQEYSEYNLLSDRGRLRRIPTLVRGSIEADLIAPYEVDLGMGTFVQVPDRTTALTVAR